MEKLSKRLQSSLGELPVDNFYPANKPTYFNSISEFLSIDITDAVNQAVSSPEYWFDDTILTRLAKEKMVYKVWGVLILGRNDDSTRQWTTPIYCEVCLNDLIVEVYVGDRRKNPIEYEKFTEDRGVWDQKFYSSDKWSYHDREWLYHNRIDMSV